MNDNRSTTVEVITIGDELLLGFTIDTNAAHLARELASIGVHIARWVTTHGFALNVNPDLSYFNLIVPCEGEPVTSMNEVLGREIPMTDVEDRIIQRFAEIFDRKAT